MASSLSSRTILLHLFLSASAFLNLLTSPVSAANRLDSGQVLGPGQSLTQGSYTFIMQQDCNLALYDSSTVVWSTGTTGRAYGCVLTLQFNGNLVIYSGSRVIWTSNSNRRIGSYYLVLQSDRNVVIFDSSNTAIWSTGTAVARAATIFEDMEAELYR